MANSEGISVSQLMRLALMVKKTKTALASDLDVSIPNLEKIMRGETHPKTPALVRLLRIVGMGAEVLDTGELPCETHHPLILKVREAETFAAADEIVLRLFDGGALHPGAVAVVDELGKRATTSDEQAIYLNRRYGVLEQQGWYVQGLDGLRQADLLRGLPMRTRMMTLVNQAGGLLDIGRSNEAIGMARGILDHYQEFPPASDARRDRSNYAYAHFVSGSACERLIDCDPERAALLAPRAERHLAAAVDGYKSLSADFPELSRFYGSIGRTAAHELLAAQVDGGTMKVADAMKQLDGYLDQCIDLDAAALEGQDLDTAGRTAVINAELASRHLSEPNRTRALAVYIGKARDIAEKTGNWRLYERVFSLEWVRTTSEASLLGRSVDFTADDEDKALIMSVMARFPLFRETGKKLLNLNGEGGAA